MLYIYLDKREILFINNCLGLLYDVLKLDMLICNYEF